jgi:hypothetical protein
VRVESLFEARDGCVADGHIRVLTLPVLHLLRTPSLFMMPTLRGSYGSSHVGAQPPPVSTVEVLVEDELGRLLQRFFSSVMGRREGARPHTPLSDITLHGGQRTHLCVKVHVPYGAYLDTFIDNVVERLLHELR